MWARSMVPIRTALCHLRGVTSWLVCRDGFSRGERRSRRRVRGRVSVVAHRARFPQQHVRTTTKSASGTAHLVASDRRRRPRFLGAAGRRAIRIAPFLPPEELTCAAARASRLAHWARATRPPKSAHCAEIPAFLV